MNFSEKQFAFINYLLEKLNFDKIDYTTKNNFTNKYLEYLSKTYISFKNIGNCESTEVVYNNQKVNIPKDGIPNLKYLYNGLIYEIENFSLINFLQLEINIKKKRKFFIKDKINLNFVSATDISNYTYCPVNYSISKTLFYKSLETAIIGTKKHEESLINNIVAQKTIPSYSQKTDEYQKAEIEYDDNFLLLKKKISDFEIIYSGHSSEAKNKIFKSKKGNFIGQPDFILRNIKTNETIVIEEKYQFIPSQITNYGYDNYYDNLEEEIEAKRNKVIFYENHLNQVSSYIYGISEYNIDYGILIYWKYEIQNNHQVVSKCSFTKVHKSEETKYNLNEIYKKVLQLNRNKEVEFNVNNRNPAKCASCVNNFLCGHKTGKYEKLTIPYNFDYLNIIEVSFPESLKKNEADIDKRPYVEKILDNISINEKKYYINPNDKPDEPVF